MASSGAKEVVFKLSMEIADFTRKQQEILSSSQNLSQSIAQSMQSIGPASKGSFDGLATNATQAFEKIKKQAHEATQEVAKSGKQMGDAMKHGMSSGGGLLNSMTDLKGSLMGIAGTLGVATMGFLTFSKVLHEVESAITLASRVDTLAVVLKQVGGNAGYSSGEMMSFAAGVQKMGITTQESYSSLTKMAQAQIDVTKSTQLARVAQDAAVIGNINSSEAFGRLIHGIQSGMTEILRTMGINVQFEKSYAQLAAQLHKNVGELDELEKVQARTNAVIEYGGRIAGVYEASMGTAGKQMLSLARYSEEASLAFGTVFQEAFSSVIMEITRYLKEAGDAMKEFNKSAEGQEASKYLKEVVEKAMELARALYDVIKPVMQLYAEWQKLAILLMAPKLVNTLVIGSLELLGNALQVVADRASSALKSLKELSGAPAVPAGNQPWSAMLGDESKLKARQSALQAELDSKQAQLAEAFKKYGNSDKTPGYIAIKFKLDMREDAIRKELDSIAPKLKLIGSQIGSMMASEYLDPGMPKAKERDYAKEAKLAEDLRKIAVQGANTVYQAKVQNINEEVKVMQDAGTQELMIIEYQTREQLKALAIRHAAQSAGIAGEQKDAKVKAAEQHNLNLSYQKEREAITIKAADQERAYENKRVDVSAEIEKTIAEHGESAYQTEVSLLDKKYKQFYSAYVKTVDDRARLDEWYNIKKKALDDARIDYTINLEATLQKEINQYSDASVQAQIEQAQRIMQKRLDDAAREGTLWRDKEKIEAAFYAKEDELLTKSAMTKAQGITAYYSKIAPLAQQNLAALEVIWAEEGRQESLKTQGIITQEMHVAQKRKEFAEQNLANQIGFYDKIRGYEGKAYELRLRQIEIEYQNNRRLWNDEAAALQKKKDDTIDAYIKMAESSDNFVVGVKAGLLDMQRSTESWAKITSNLVKAIFSEAASSMSATLFDIYKGNINITKASDLSSVQGQLTSLANQKEILDNKKKEIAANNALTDSEKTTQTAAIDAQLKQIDVQTQLLGAQKTAIENSKSMGEVFQQLVDRIAQTTFTSLTTKFMGWAASELVNADWFKNIFGDWLSDTAGKSEIQKAFDNVDLEALTTKTKESFQAGLDSLQYETFTSQLAAAFQSAFNGVNFEGIKLPPLQLDLGNAGEDWWSNAPGGEGGSSGGGSDIAKILGAVGGLAGYGSTLKNLWDVGSSAFGEGDFDWDGAMGLLGKLPGEAGKWGGYANKAYKGIKYGSKLYNYFMSDGNYGLSVNPQGGSAADFYSMDAMENVDWASFGNTFGEQASEILAYEAGPEFGAQAGGILSYEAGPAMGAELASGATEGMAAAAPEIGTAVGESMMGGVGIGAGAEGLAAGGAGVAGGGGAGMGASAALTAAAPYLAAVMTIYTIADQMNTWEMGHSARAQRQIGGSLDQMSAINSQGAYAQRLDQQYGKGASQKIALEYGQQYGGEGNLPFNTKSLTLETATASEKADYLLEQLKNIRNYQDDLDDGKKLSEAAIRSLVENALGPENKALADAVLMYEKMGSTMTNQIITADEYGDQLKVLKSKGIDEVQKSLEGMSDTSKRTFIESIPDLNNYGQTLRGLGLDYGDLQSLAIDTSLATWDMQQAQTMLDQGLASSQPAQYAALLDSLREAIAKNGEEFLGTIPNIEDYIAILEALGISINELPTEKEVSIKVTTTGEVPQMPPSNGMAFGGWIGTHPQGGWLTGGSGTRDDVYLGATPGVHHWGMGGEFVVNKNASAKYGKLLQVLNANYDQGGYLNVGYQTGGLRKATVGYGDPLDETAKQHITNLKAMMEGADDTFRKILMDIAGGIGGAATTMALEREQVLKKLPENQRAYQQWVYDLEDSAKKRSLEVELMKLEGRTSEALNVERTEALKGLTDEQQTIQRSIYFWEDHAKVYQKQIELTRLGTRAWEAEDMQRRETLKGLTDQENFYQKAIWAWEDANKIRDLEIELLGAQGRSYDQLNRQRELEIVTLRPAEQAIKRQIWAAQDLAKTRALENDLMKAQGLSYVVLLREREDELKGLNNNDKALKRAIYAQEDLNKVRALETELLNAQGRTWDGVLRQRENELKALSPAEQALKQQIWAAQLVSEQDKLRIDLLKAQGKEEEALALERANQLKGMEPSLAAIKRQIFAEEDLKKAMDEATSSLDPKKFHTLIDYTMAKVFTAAGLPVPKFAAGGLHRGGLRIVGEMGPELEWTGPSSIISNSGAKSALSSKEVVAEIKALRDEMGDVNYSIAASNAKMARILDRWDGDGMPSSRDTGSSPVFSS